jgi:hypothetical protein
MLKLINYTPSVFDTDKNFKTLPGVSDWLSVYSFIGYSVALNDRSNNIKIPVNTIVPDHLAMPEFRETTLSYRDCCHKKVKDLITMSEETGKEICLMYSGGVDSSVVLSSFIELLGVNGAAKKINIFMSQESILENPVMWEKFIRPHFKVTNSKLYRKTGIDKDNILVFGELNDQLFGSDILKNVSVWAGRNILNDKFTVEMGIKYLTEYCKMNTRHAAIWSELLLENLKSCPRHNSSVWDVFWWYNFSLKWINVYYRYLMRCNIDAELIQSQIDTSYCAFFNTEDFQLWSMNNNEDKHQGTWDSYKYAGKQLVAEVTADTNFFNRTKKNSLQNVLMLSERTSYVFENNVMAQTTDDITLLYNSDNYFVNYHG